MTCYVDDCYFYIFSRNKMCHMMADTEDELDSMADRIGIGRIWKQNAGTRMVHYNICWSKRQKAIKAGAIEVTAKQLAIIKQEASHD